MIIDHIDNAKQYYCLDSDFETVFSFLKQIDSNTADGRYTIKGEDIFANVVTLQTSTLNGRQFEAHERYLDIHYILEGEEYMEYAQTCKLHQDNPYCEEDDCALFSGKGSTIFSRAGEFYLVYPQDAHKPNGTLTASSKLRKVVVKIRI